MVGRFMFHPPPPQAIRAEIFRISVSIEKRNAPKKKCGSYRARLRRKGTTENNPNRRWKFRVADNTKFRTAQPTESTPNQRTFSVNPFVVSAAGCVAAENRDGRRGFGLCYDNTWVLVISRDSFLRYFGLYT